MKKRKVSVAEQCGAQLEVVGADANNLQSVNVNFPLHQVTMVVGVSGSGKSSLLEDTLAAEAGRRMRTFLGIHPPRMEGPPPRAFVGPMPATVHVGQRTFRGSARTTVGTGTGLLAILRRLFLAAGRPYSDELGRYVSAPSPESYAEWLVKHYRGQATLWAVPVRFVATDGVRTFERLRGLGIEQVVVRSETDSPLGWEKGRTVRLVRFMPLEPTVRHIIEASMGALDIGPRTNMNKLRGLLARAFEAGGGAVVVELAGATLPDLQGPFGPRLDSTLHWVEPDLATCFSPPSSHLLSFNAPEHPESGACRTCKGLGRAVVLDERALVSHPERSMHEGAFVLWTEKNYKYVNIQHETIEGLRGMRGFSPDVPWKRLPEEARRLVLDGAGLEQVIDRERETGRKLSAPRPFEGFRQAILERVSRGTKVAQSLAPLVREGPCHDCGGTRWSFQARALRVGGLGIHHLLALPFAELAVLTQEGHPLGDSLPREARGLVRHLHDQAQSFASVGLGHLSGSRGMLEISGGEGRRTQLAGVLNARSAGLCLLLDEPARGLHDEDLVGLADAIASLAPNHTVVMNEHRQALVHAADHLVQLGPGAGAAGGRIQYTGPVVESEWTHPPHIERMVPPTREQPRWLTIQGATLNNLQGVDCKLPLGRLTCLTGVSGSGKSSFVRGVLVPSVLRALGKPPQLDDFELRPGSWTGLQGTEHLSGVVALDQGIPPTNRRSIVATFLELAERLRTVFGASDGARVAGLSASDFGLNAGQGRCQFCLGLGEVAEHELWTTCPVCGGLRYGQEALSVHVEGMSIGDLLALPVSKLRETLPSFLAPHMSVLEAMEELGIGHVSLGRRVDTLSGGEVQRLRIARKLSEHDSGGLLFVLDEPAAGLHPQDVALLLRALDRILSMGRNTVVLVEHNAAIIGKADWLIEFGPGGGPRGGQVMAMGPPAEVRKTDTATGRMLSGRTARARRHRHGPTQVPAQPVDEDLRGQAVRMGARIRQLIGDDIAPLDPPAEPSAPDRPVVLLDERLWNGRRPWEIGDLDQELARLLLDIEVRGVRPEDVHGLAKQWEKQGEGLLVIHPFLKELQAWGPRPPRSTVEVARRHAQAMGLKLLAPDGKEWRKGMDVDWLRVRATGARFVPRTGGSAERRRLVADALLLGSGRVELRGHDGELRGVLQTRLMDLEQGVVGPMEAAPFHFSRQDPRGRCPTCKGSGGVLALKEELVIGDRRASLEDERFLHPAAAAVMKGVRRAEMLPFFRRMADEGLWAQGTPYHRLDESARNVLLYGCWTRPGHGTFLKDAKADASEVNAWLRWDGLYHHLAQQYARSTDTKWKPAVESTRSIGTCPACEGTGLSIAARLLLLDGCSLQEWVRKGSVGELFRALEALRASTPRQERMKQRVLDCLAPLVGKGREWKLLALADAETAQAVGQQVVSAFTDMRAVQP
jgi:excinuclease ABC A subunit